MCCPTLREKTVLLQPKFNEHVECTQYCDPRLLGVIGVHWISSLSQRGDQWSYRMFCLVSESGGEILQITLHCPIHAMMKECSNQRLKVATVREDWERFTSLSIHSMLRKVTLALSCVSKLHQ
jgi:hypothetical protein